MENRKGPKRLTLDVPDELHHDVKVRAVQRNVSLKVWLLQAIFEKIAQEKRFE